MCRTEIIYAAAAEVVCATFSVNDPQTCSDSGGSPPKWPRDKHDIVSHSSPSLSTTVLCSMAPALKRQEKNTAWRLGAQTGGCTTTPSDSSTKRTMWPPIRILLLNCIATACLRSADSCLALPWILILLHDKTALLPPTAVELAPGRRGHLPDVPQPDCGRILFGGSKKLSGKWKWNFSCFLLSPPSGWSL